ncbi:DNA cytosine methyltransferase [Natrinema hispanicum]|uniref:DNA (cytosine-5-)-methyltransferase n=1 Tax=Natrinema hispanicum TaxID=392421 RepID=A0A1H9YQH0_9EURY|nr:DNA cytosine methyltransferase [Natrinema hispanicum]SES70747.1 DNA (cytosine-5)-methyltransferase 1 [Natrinema hispanicum]
MSDGPSCVDLFCGAGGFSLGFEYAGFDILVASDYHETAGKTYQANFDHPFLQADISNLADDVQPLLDKGEFSTGDVDVLVGGPPCKGFSITGSQNEDDARNTLFRRYIDVLEALKPDAIIIENVPGVKSIKDGAYVDEIISRTRDLGYNTRMLELNSANYGVPQRRERVFFIGYRDSHPVSRPRRTHITDTGQQRLGSVSETRSCQTVEEAMSDLAFLGIGESSTEYMDIPHSDYQRLMRKNHSGSLYNHTAPNHGTRVQERFEAMEPGDSMDDLPEKLQTSKYTLHRLRPDQPSPTITTLPEDLVHYSRNRIPTVREMARLQSFPDWFKFEGPRTTGGNRRDESLPQYSQVGNAVPPIMAEALARHVRATLEGDDPAKAAEERLDRLDPS